MQDYVVFFSDTKIILSTGTQKHYAVALITIILPDISISKLDSAVFIGGMDPAEFRLFKPESGLKSLRNTLVFYI